MTAAHPRNAPQSTVTVDRLFAPAPHGLINDPEISHPAFRLWCVLHRLAWIKQPPEMDRLCDEMTQGAEVPTRRSVYRWLSQLESRGWLEWTRTPGKASLNRFLVLSERKPVTYMSQVNEPVTPESQPVTPESQVVQFHARPERPKKPPLDHENHIDHGGGARARESNTTAPERTDPLIVLFARYDITQAEPLARLYHEKWPDVTIDQLTRLCESLFEPDAGSYAGARLYRKLKAGPYERQRSLQSDIPQDRPHRSALAARGKHNPTGGSLIKDPGWIERELARIQEAGGLSDDEMRT